MHVNNLDIFGKLEHIMFCRADCCLNLANSKKPEVFKVEDKFDVFLLKTSIVEFSYQAFLKLDWCH